MRDLIRRILQTSYLLLSCILALFTVYLCYAIEWRGPFRDLWEFIGVIQQQLNGNWDLHPLIEPYGGIHRILIPKLLFYLDYRLASGNNLLALTVTLTLHIGACGLIIHSIGYPASSHRKNITILIAIILLFFFSTTQIYNLIYISDNQVVIGNSLAIFGAVAFCRYMQENKILYLCISNLLIVLACLSHSSSLMMLPASVLIMFIMGKSRQGIILQIIFSSLLLGWYVTGDDPLSISPEASLWEKMFANLYGIIINLPGILKYIGLHLSSPTSREYTIAGIIIGYASIGYLVNVCWRAHKKQWRLDDGEILWLTLACYGAFIAFITATGRQIYPNSALTDRYQTLVMTYWASTMLIMMADIEKNKPALTFIPPLFSLALLLPYQYKNAESMAWLSSRVNIAHTAAITGITDIDSVAATLSHPLLMDKKNLVAEYNDFLREKGLGYFSEETAKYFLTKNKTMPLIYDANNIDPCPGRLVLIEKTGKTNTGYRFAVDSINTKHIEYLLVIDKQKNIIGLARYHRPRGEFLPLALQNSTAQQWIGFINPPLQPAYPLELIAKTTGGFCKALEITL